MYQIHQAADKFCEVYEMVSCSNEINVIRWMPGYYGSLILEYETYDNKRAYDFEVAGMFLEKHEADAVFKNLMTDGLDGENSNEIYDKLLLIQNMEYGKFNIEVKYQYVINLI